MHIVASADIGEFGPADGEPVSYHFSPLHHAQGLVPWLLLPLAFVALKENRTVQAALIFTPIALLGMIYLVVMKLLRMDSGSVVQLNVLFAIMVLGFSMIWLLAERIGNRSRFVTFLLAALVYFGFLGLTLLSRGLGKDMISIASLAAVSIPPILLAFLIAARSSSKAFSKARFLAYMGASLFGSLLIITAAVMFILQPSPNRPVDSQLVEVLGFSLLFSLAYFAGLLPFLVLLFANSFWRRRFECVVGIRTNTREESA